MLLGLIGQSLLQDSIRLGFSLAFSFNYFIWKLDNQIKYYLFMEVWFDLNVKILVVFNKRLLR